MSRLSSHHLGVILVALSAVLWSTAGLFVRMAQLDSWTIVAWRSFFACITLGIMAFAEHRGRVVKAVAALDVQALISMALAVISTIAYVFALRLTSVANVMTIYAAMPFVTTAIAYFWLRERVTKRFILAGGMGLVGMCFAAGAAANSNDAMGLVMSVVMTVTFAMLLVHAKRHPHLDMTLASIGPNIICLAIALPFAQRGIPAPLSLLACALFGAVTNAIAYLLILIGGRLLPSGETALISLIDIVLGPLWVWLFFAERPSANTVIGGAIVLASVIWYLAGRSFAERALENRRSA